MKLKRFSTSSRVNEREWKRIIGHRKFVYDIQLRKQSFVPFAALSSTKLLACLKNQGQIIRMNCGREGTRKNDKSLHCTDKRVTKRRKYRS